MSGNKVALATTTSEFPEMPISHEKNVERLSPTVWQLTSGFGHPSGLYRLLNLHRARVADVDVGVDVRSAAEMNHRIGAFNPPNVPDPITF